MTLEQLSTEANNVQTALQGVGSATAAHLANVTGAKLPFNIGFATAANGAVAEAISKIGVHIQSLNKQLAEQAAAAKEAADAKAAQIAADEATAAAAAKTAVDAALANVAKLPAAGSAAAPESKSQI